MHVGGRLMTVVLQVVDLIRAVFADELASLWVSKLAVPSPGAWLPELELRTRQGKQRWA